MHELDAIAVIGGTSRSGGRGSIIGITLLPVMQAMRLSVEAQPPGRARCDGFPS